MNHIKIQNIKKYTDEFILKSFTDNYLIPNHHMTMDIIYSCISLEKEELSLKLFDLYFNINNISLIEKYNQLINFIDKFNVCKNNVYIKSIKDFLINCEDDIGELIREKILYLLDIEEDIDSIIREYESYRVDDILILTKILNHKDILMRHVLWLLEIKSKNKDILKVLFDKMIKINNLKMLE